ERLPNAAGTCSGQLCWLHGRAVARARVCDRELAHTCGALRADATKPPAHWSVQCGILGRLYLLTRVGESRWLRGYVLKRNRSISMRCFGRIRSSGTWVTRSSTAWPPG